MVVETNYRKFINDTKLAHTAKIVVILNLNQHLGIFPTRVFLISNRQTFELVVDLNHVLIRGDVQPGDERTRRRRP